MWQNLQSKKSQMLACLSYLRLAFILHRLALLSFFVLLCFSSSCCFSADFLAAFATMRCCLTQPLTLSASGPLSVNDISMYAATMASALRLHAWGRSPGTMAGCLTLLRRVPWAVAAVRSGDWSGVPGTVVYLSLHFLLWLTNSFCLFLQPYGLAASGFWSLRPPGALTRPRPCAGTARSAWTTPKTSISHLEKKHVFSCRSHQGSPFSRYLVLLFNFDDVWSHSHSKHIFGLKEKIKWAFIFETVE